jgi:hypothetical protein
MIVTKPCSLAAVSDFGSALNGGILACFGALLPTDRYFDVAINHNNFEISEMTKKIGMKYEVETPKQFFSQGMSHTHPKPEGGRQGAERGSSRISPSCSGR